MKLRMCLVMALGSLLASGVAFADKMADGEALVRAMHSRYQSNWYDTLTFTQKSTTINPDGATKVETWYEAAMLPGKLRIDIGPPAEGNGALLVDGTAYFFQKGEQKGTRPLVNMLLVLGFDVYRQSPEITIAQLKAEGIDLSKLHEDSWQGEPVYVVGAEQGDLKSKQFWVGKKRLLFVRIIEPDQQDPKKTGDTRFADYRQLPSGMIAARVEDYSDGKLVFTEDYSDIQTGVNLSPAIFDPAQFSKQHWEK
jgi:hypothetical protein